MAASAGFEMVGVRLAPAHPADRSLSLLDSPALLRRLSAALESSGLGVLEAEVVRLRPESRTEDFDRHLEAAAALRARFVLTVSHDGEEERAAERLAALAERAGALDLRVALEFMAFSEARTAAEAARLVALAGHPRLGVLADSLHLYRSGGTAADLAGLPLLAAQLCDGPSAAPEDLAREARTARLMPGEGDLPLGDFVAMLPRDLPVSLEVPSSTPEDWQERARRARNLPLLRVRRGGGVSHPPSAG